jgi:hypothetical protein
VCAFFCVCVQVEALRKAEVNGEVHGGRPRPTGAVVLRNIKKDRNPRQAFLILLR